MEIPGMTYARDITIKIGKFEAVDDWLGFWDESDNETFLELKKDF